MKKKYDTIVYTGRFEPFHNAHLKTMLAAAELADQVIVIIGSAHQPRTFKNPFTWTERRDMIHESLAFTDVYKKAHFIFEPNRDTIYNDPAWVVRVQEIVDVCTDPTHKIAIIGYEKDSATKEYLNMFPQWDLVKVAASDPLNATDIRKLYFNHNFNMNFVANVIPDSVLEFLTKFRNTEDFDQIIREREHIEEYKKQFAALPYEPIFVTADAVVFQSGHVLMVKRKSEPGKGLWALPGGFVNASTDKSVRAAAIRELEEETQIALSTNTLDRCITDYHVFDAINRSARGRTITHAFKFELYNGPLTKVKGADDAEKARWVPISELDSSEVFEDHYEIIQHFLGA